MAGSWGIAGDRTQPGTARIRTSVQVGGPGGGHWEAGVLIEAEPGAKGSSGHLGRWREQRAGPHGLRGSGRALPAGPAHPSARLLRAEAP